MIAYWLTAAFVALSVFVVISCATTARFSTHDWPIWIRFGLAWLVGIFWPVLSLWAIGACLRGAAVAAWRWALGDNNKRRGGPLEATAMIYGDGPISGEMEGFGLRIYDNGGRIRSHEPN